MDEETANVIDEVSIIMRNTNYNRDLSLEKLNALGNVEAVIKDYLGIREEKISTTSVNQGIYTSIRKFLDGKTD
jgi:hypothetical protein